MHNIAQTGNLYKSIYSHQLYIILSFYINFVHCCHLIWAENRIYEYSIPKETSYPSSANEYLINIINSYMVGVGLNWHEILQCGAPKIAKLVYNSNNYGLWHL